MLLSPQLAIFDHDAHKHANSECQELEFKRCGATVFQKRLDSVLAGFPFSMFIFGHIREPDAGHAGSCIEHTAQDATTLARAATVVVEYGLVGVTLV